MPFVLSGKRGEMVVESRSVRYDLAFTVDPVTLRPVVEHARSQSEVSAGTRITLKWPRSLEGDRDGLTWLAENFACFNRNLAITVGGRQISALDPEWRKWRPNGPPVAHWYNVTSLKRLMQAYAAEADEKGEPSPTVGTFLRDFVGAQKHPEDGGDRQAARARPRYSRRSPARPGLRGLHLRAA